MTRHERPDRLFSLSCRRYQAKALLMTDELEGIFKITFWFSDELFSRGARRYARMAEKASPVTIFEKLRKFIFSFFPHLVASPSIADSQARSAPAQAEPAQAQPDRAYFSQILS